MNLRQAENIVHRFIITNRPLDSAPRFVRRALAVLERKEQASGAHTPREQYSLALSLYDEVVAKGEAYKARAAARVRLADYIESKVLPQYFDFKILTAAEKLRAARQTGTYGRRPDGSLVTIWDDKSGLSKLDPDEAREESQRLAERYGAHVLQLAKQGKGLHYMVLTIPNVPAGELAEAQQALFRKWVNFKRTQCNKQKAFPEIIGDLVIMEAPLAADGKWNVHLNVLLVTERPFHAGLYERIRRAWKFNCFMRPVSGDAGEIARAFNELLKYGMRAVPEKSHSKASQHATDAPAMIEWPAERFVEWFEAQQGFKRTRTYGCLYGEEVPKPEPQSLDGVVWLGSMTLAPTFFRVQVPLVTLILGDKYTTKTPHNHQTGPP